MTKNSKISQLKINLIFFVNKWNIFILKLSVSSNRRNLQTSKRTSSTSKHDFLKIFNGSFCLPVSTDPAESGSGSATPVTREEKI
jgi:hypothetical protein